MASEGNNRTRTASVPRHAHAITRPTNNIMAEQDRAGQDCHNKTRHDRPCYMAWHGTTWPDVKWHEVYGTRTW